MTYRNKKVLVTGGLGFIGSNLAIRLAELGARVVILDPLVPGCGGNLANIDLTACDVQVISASIGEDGVARDALRGCDVIFNLAGEISHIHSMEMPERDLEINTLAQLRFLLQVKEFAPGIRIVYAGTRQVYGAPEYLPVDEKHPINPVDFNGVHKYAATMYHLMMSNMGHLDAVVLRLTNVYGPRMALDIPCQGFLSDFLRKVLTGRRLEIFGDGRQLRDPVFVDEIVDAMLLAGGTASLPKRFYNVGGPAALSLAEIARTASRLANVEEPVFREFPEERKAIDIGSYFTDSTAIRDDLRWKAATAFETGFAATLAYYRERLPMYLDPSEPNPVCRIHQSPRSANVAAIPARAPV